MVVAVPLSVFLTRLLFISYVEAGGHLERENGSIKTHKHTSYTNYLHNTGSIVVHFQITIESSRHSSPLIIEESTKCFHICFTSQK